MDASNSRTTNRLPPLIDPVSESKELLDKTYYEAEHIPRKVYMRPLKCAADPRLRLNLTHLPAQIPPNPVIKKSASGIKSPFSHQNKGVNRTIVLQEPEPSHVRHASDIISTLKLAPKTPETVKTLQKSSSKHRSKASVGMFSTLSPISKKHVKTGSQIRIGVRKLIAGLSMALSTGFPSSPKLRFVPVCHPGRTALKLR